MSFDSNALASAPPRKVGRNDPCPCGSGRKYKKCHLLADEAARHPRAIPPQVIADLHRQMQEGLFFGPRSQKVSFKGKTFRVLWNKLLIREPTETFHEFLIDTLKRTLGQKWIDNVKRPNEHRHVVMRWIYAWHELAARAIPADHKAGQVFSARQTGAAKALLALADDVYRLQLVHRLPHQLLERLRSPELFQGARYEVAVAATFVRCGFEVEWLKEKRAKHCEFVARHRTTREVIGVETKSRHRAGSLNKPGALDIPSLGVDVTHLFREALDQDPRDKPFAIFLDLNFPRRGDARQLMEQLKPVIDAGPPSSATDPSPYTLLCVTNFAWHYDGEEEPQAGQWVMTVPIWARHSLQDQRTLAALQRAIDLYGYVAPDE